MFDFASVDFTQLFLKAIDEQLQELKTQAAECRKNLDQAKLKLARTYVMQEAMRGKEDKGYYGYDTMLAIAKSDLWSAWEELQSAEMELEQLRVFQYDLTQDPSKLQAHVEALAAVAESAAEYEEGPFTPFDVDEDVPF